MNEILQDLIAAINSIPEFYYSVPNIAVRNDNLTTVSDEIKHYERRFVSQLKSEYDKLIRNGATGNYQDVNTDFEVIKRYIYCEYPDNSIVDSYNKLSKRDSNKSYDTIKTIPDFFIHKEQNNKDEEFQKLAVEVKTVSPINIDDFFLDVFKLNVYVEKYRFQNGVYLIVNNDLSRIKELSDHYKAQQLYIAPTQKDRISLFVKRNYNCEIETFKLIDN